MQRLSRAFGHPQVTSETGGEIPVVTAVCKPGFSPLDLMFSALAGCLVLGGRIAASKLACLSGWKD